MIQCDLSLLISSGFEGCSTTTKLFLDLLNLEFWLGEKYGISKDSYYILYNGKIINTLGEKLNISHGVLRIIPRTFGGKGGFGSMLRAIGAQIEKTTNREACRDLSGRRLRDINEEQRLKNWIAQQADREIEAVERKKKKLERLCQEPKHDFKDDKYDESRSAMTEAMSSSVEQGLKASASGTTIVKRKRDKACTNKVPSKKKKTLWIDAEESDSSLEESSENEEETQVCNNDLIVIDNVSPDVGLP